jgi:DNA-binding CsgD family transcriptional regulator
MAGSGENHYRFWVEAAAVVDDVLIIALHDAHGTIVWISAAPEGATVEEALGTHPWDWAAEREKSRVKAYFSTAITVGETQCFYAQVVVAGRELTLDCRIDPTGIEGVPIISRTRVLDHKVSLLTEREKEVAALTARGLRASQIGEELGISRSTVDSHRSALRKKLKAKTLAEVALFAMRNLVRA